MDERESPVCLLILAENIKVGIIPSAYQQLASILRGVDQVVGDYFFREKVCMEVIPAENVSIFLFGQGGSLIYRRIVIVEQPFLSSLRVHNRDRV